MTARRSARRRQRKQALAVRRLADFRRALKRAGLPGLLDMLGQVSAAVASTRGAPGVRP